MPDQHDSRSWRARAEECRSLAEVFSSPQTRARMLSIAGGYDEMAQAAERRELELAAGHSPPEKQGNGLHATKP
ncbi:MAG TPA: hypothetical protein VLX44_12415 [Xanthobacteraceae bacterium]|nr:hypothetical protein [Xanthobacteraceae bacterium]